MKRVKNMYHSKGLRVTQVNTDNEFKCIREDVRQVHMNAVVAGEHVRDIERSERTIKEGKICHAHILLYKRYSK